MNDIINIPQDDRARIVVSDRTSPEFLQTAQAVGDYLKALPLSVEQNDTLIALIGKNMAEAECGAFRLGVRLGVRIGKEPNP